MEEITEFAEDASSAAVAEKLPAPKGIGVAVAFDWGLTVQLLVMPFLPLLFGGPNPLFGESSPLKQFHLSTGVSTLVSFFVSLPFAILIAIFGEGIRRGWRWTRPIQVVVGVLGFVGGFFSLVTLWQGMKRGSYWSLTTVVILLIFAPLIAWRLSRPETRRWFAAVTSAQARQRHGGTWPLQIGVFALIGGVLQALAVFFH